MVPRGWITKSGVTPSAHNNPIWVGATELCWLPVGARFSQPQQHLVPLLRPSWPPLREEVSVELMFTVLGTQQGHLFVQAQDSLRRVRIELEPITHMLFRTEEVHLSSTLPACYGHATRGVPVPNYGGWIGRENLPITNLNADAFVAVKARTIDTNNFTREQPADRQRVWSSLGEPLLLAIHRDPVLVGYNR